MVIRKMAEGGCFWSEPLPGVWQTLEGLQLKVPRQMQVVRATLASLETWGLELGPLELVSTAAEITLDYEWVYMIHYRPGEPEEWLGMAGHQAAPFSLRGEGGVFMDQLGHQRLALTLLLGRGDMERVAEFEGVQRFKRPQVEAMFFPQQVSWAEAWVGVGENGVLDPEWRVYQLCLQDKYNAGKGLALWPEGLYLPIGERVGKQLGMFEEVVPTSGPGPEGEESSRV